jgi:hypothetical protein
LDIHFLLLRESGRFEIGGFDFIKRRCGRSGRMVYTMKQTLYMFASPMAGRTGCEPVVRARALRELSLDR